MFDIRVLIVALVFIATATLFPTHPLAQQSGVAPFDEALKDLICERYPEVPDCNAQPTAPRRSPAGRSGVLIFQSTGPQEATCVGDDKSVCVCTGKCEAGDTCKCIAPNPYGDLPPPPQSGVDEQRFGNLAASVPDNLLRRAGIKRQDLTRVGRTELPIVAKGVPGSTSAPNQTVSEVIKYCEGCECHYGVCSVETMTCEYVGSGIEESMC